MFVKFISRWQRSISVRTLVPLAILGLLSAGALSWYTNSVLMKRLRGEIVDEGRRCIDVVRYVAEITGDSPELVRMVNSMGGERDIRRLLVVNGETKKIIASTESILLGRSSGELPSALSTAIDSALQSDSAKESFRGSDEILTIVSPFFLPSAVSSRGSLSKVVVAVELSTSEIRGSIERLRLAIGGGILLCLAVTILLMHFGIRRIVLRRLHRLSETVKDIPPFLAGLGHSISTTEKRILLERDLAELDRGGDELGRLASTIGTMFAQIRDTTVSKGFVDDIFESLVDSLIVVDRSLRVLRVNRAVIELLGYSGQELVGRNLSLLFAEEDCRKKIADFLESEDAAALTTETVWKTKSGQRIDVFLTLSPVFDARRRITGFIAVGEDISEKKHLEAELLRAQKLESIGQLAAGIAHEINTPIQYIGDNVAFLRSSFDDFLHMLSAYEELSRVLENNDKYAEAMRAVEEAVARCDVSWLRDEIPRALKDSVEGVKHVSKIVQSMKEFAHPAGKEKTFADLNRIIEATTTVSRNEWKYHADLETDLDPALPPILCHPNELTQVVLNLVVNAAHAVEAGKKNSEDGGMIRVSTRFTPERKEVELRVSDTGTGILPEIQGKIFDPFFTTKEVGKGTGQGLAIVHSVIRDKHQGSVSFETEPGKGTTFVIRIPLGDPLAEEVP